MWMQNRLENTDLTCLSNFPVATYSGMLPGVLAGLYREAQMQIDLVRLCAKTGARLLTDTVTGLDLIHRRVLFQDRPAVPFDVLSIGIGSVPATDHVEITDQSVVCIKPMQTFLPRLRTALGVAGQRCTAASLQVAVVGGGVAGIEVALCLKTFLRQQTERPFQITVVAGSRDILPGVSASMRTRARRALDGLKLVTGKMVTQVGDGAVVLDDHSRHSADLVIWATGAAAPPIFQRLGLPLDDRGFLLTDSTLQVVGQQAIFAVGDSGSLEKESIPKAGVYAVRQGPVLWENIQRSVRHKSLQHFRPQHNFLKLLNIGDGQAIGEWKGFSFQGRWAMKLKDRIDRKFMSMYQMSGSPMEQGAMPCRGCGCKLSSDVLRSSLDSGLTGHAQQKPELDDAAIIEFKSGASIGISTDFFSAPFDDAYLNGRVAAAHAASDLIATGLQIRSAVANVVIPEGTPASQQQILSDILAGANREFSAMGATIVGGHTITGPRWELGFTVVGEQTGRNLLRKSGLQVDDRLYLTKPLGTGILLAAHMRGCCAAEDYSNLVQTMLNSQHQLAKIAVECGVISGTDVTGFGLLGHLAEMLEASQMSAVLCFDRIPVLSGVKAALSADIQSTLAPSNRSILNHVEASGAIRNQTEFPVLWDPQTCGGLLLAVPEANCELFQTSLRNDCISSVVLIGEIVESTSNIRRITVL